MSFLILWCGRSLTRFTLGQIPGKFSAWVWCVLHWLFARVLYLRVWKVHYSLTLLLLAPTFQFGAWTAFRATPGLQVLTARHCFIRFFLGTTNSISWLELRAWIIFVIIIVCFIQQFWYALNTVKCTVRDICAVVYSSARGFFRLNLELLAP